ncbi:MAG: PAAR domain-containing protein [Myxococcota bacterium]
MAESPLAKEGDIVAAIDTHIVIISTPGGPVDTPTPLPFRGALDGDLSPTVKVDDMPAATEGSQASNSPAHSCPAGPFKTPPSDTATIDGGSGTVMIDDRPAARDGDPAVTCDDVDPSAHGTVMAGGTVICG